FPALGHVERQRPARFQIRLVEARKGFVCARGNEDRVEEVVVAIEWTVAGVEIELEAVLAGLERRRRVPQVTAGSRREVEQQRPRRVAQREADSLVAFDRGVPVFRNREGELVADVRDASRALARKRLADAGVLSRRDAREAQEHECVTEEAS